MSSSAAAAASAASNSTVQQTLMEQRRFDELVADAKDFDPDKKFMAANDLSNALVNGSLKPTDYDTVVKILLSQLNDDSSEVQGNSIRCLSKIINKLGEAQVENVSKTMIQKVIEDKGEYRDVYATCLKTLINSVPSNYAKAVQPILQHAILGMDQKVKSGEVDVQEELCEILNNLFKKWSSVLSTANANVKNLTNILVGNILLGERNSLKKKSCGCLGSLCLIIPKEEVGRIVQQLLASIVKPKDQKQLLRYIREKQIYVVYALSAISKSGSRKLGGNLKELLKYILTDIHTSKQNLEEDYDLVIVVSEMFESYLSILESLIRGSHDETKEFFVEIVDLAAELINFDPNGTASVSSQGMEIEDSNGYDDEDMEYLSDDQDSDDSSWRVRKASLSVIETLVRSDSDLIKLIFEKCVTSRSDTSTIVNRLKEKNENIRFATFSCLQTIIKSIVIAETAQDKDEDMDIEFSSGPQLVRVKSAVREFNISEIISQIVANVTDILEKEKKASQAILSGGYRLLETISRNLSRQVVSDHSIWAQVLGVLHSTITKRSSANELKVSAFSCLRRLLKSISSDISQTAHVASDLLSLLELSRTGISHEHFKVVSESYRFLGSLFFIIHKHFSSKLSQVASVAAQLAEKLILKLSGSEVDQEVKQSVISCTGSLLINLPEILSAGQVSQILSAISEKVKQESKKIPLLKLLRKLPTSITTTLTAASETVLIQISDAVVELIAKQERSLRVASLEALERLVSVLTQRGVVLTPRTREAFFNIEKELLNDKDAWLTSLFFQVAAAIVDNQKGSPQAFTKLTQNILAYAGTTIVVNQQLFELLAVLSKNSLLNQSTSIDSLINLTTATRDSYQSIAKSIAAIVSETPNANTRKDLISRIFKQAQTSDVTASIQQICLMALGEIGKRVNLCDEGNILQEVQQILSNKKNSEEIRTAASLSFGGIAVGNLEKVLPQVIQTINNGGEGQYFMLTSLKSIVEHTHTLSQNVIHVIPNLFKAIQSDDESLCNIIASIIGRVAVSNLKEMKNVLLEQLHSKHAGTRYTTASAFKYFCLKTTKVDADIRELVFSLLQSINDVDLKVRAAVLRSLGLIAHNLPATLIAHITKTEFFLPLQATLRFSQIREIDFGPFKQKNDEGEPVRNAAFQLLDTAIDHLHYRGVENFEREILEEALFNFAAESSEDIKIIRFQICTKFAHKIPLKVSAFLDTMSEVFLNVLKPYANKNDGDRAADMVRAGLIASQTIKDIAEDESNQKYLAYWELVMKTEKYKNIIISFTQ